MKTNLEEQELGGYPNSQNQSVISRQRSIERDRLELAQAGKAQVFKRNFGLISMTGFSCGLMGTWEAVLVVFAVGSENGGPAGLLYGLLFISLGVLSVFTVIGELASMVPTSSGQYHWVAILAPPSSRKFWSYLTGWLNVAGWIGALATTVVFLAGVIQELAALNFPSYNAKGWQTTLLYWAILIVCFGINTLLSRSLPALETLVLILHVVAFFAIGVPLLYLAPKGSLRAAFTTWRNDGGWPTQALSFFIGLNGNAVGFVGTDGPVHMSEETRNASFNVPRSMVLSTFINAVLAFCMMMIVLVCSGEASTYAGAEYPFIPILSNAYQSKAAATGATLLIITIQFITSTGSIAAASRLVWSFSRDRGLPGWQTLSKVNPETTMPIGSIVFVTALSAVLALINAGSEAAFTAILSITLEALFASYFIACILLLYRRLKGQIGLTNINGERDPRHLYTWGRWHIPGILGTLNNIFACCYSIIICFFSFWPATIPVTPQNMNYSSLVTGAVAIGSVVYYFSWGNRTYRGPIIEVRA